MFQKTLGVTVFALSLSGVAYAQTEIETEKPAEAEKPSEPALEPSTPATDTASPPMGNGEAAPKKDKPMMGHQMKASDISAHIQSWPAEARTAAQETIAKYGQPDEVTNKKLIWNEKGDFKRIAVMSEPVDHKFPMPHKDVLAYVIDYKVPAEKFDDLAMFDGSLSADRTDGTLTARCNNHAMNLAALNLADDIVKGKKNVQQAREALDKAAQQVQQGNPPVLAQRLQFNAQQQTATADPDKPSDRAMGR